MMNFKSLKTGDKPFFAFALTFFSAVLLPEYFAPVMTLFCLIFSVNKKTKKENIGYIGLSIFLLIALNVICIVFTSSVVSSLASILLWLFMMNGYFAAIGTVNSFEKIEVIIYLGCISAGIMGLIASAEIVLFHFGKEYVGNLFNPFWHWLDLSIEKIVGILPDAVSANFASKTFKTFDTRACSTLSNPLFFATIEIMLLPFTAYEFLCQNNKKRNIVGFVCLVLTCLGIAFSYSRGPYIYALVVGVILLVYGGKKAIKLLSTGVVGLGALYILANGTFKRLLSLTNSQNISVSTRKRVWSAVFDMIKKKPILGYGTGFDNVRQMLHNTYKVMQPHAHNIFLEMWLENGILGPVILAAVFIVSIIELFIVFKRNKKYYFVAITLFASLLGVILCGMTDCIFYGLKPLQYLMMLLGLIQATYFTAKQDIT